MKRPVIILGNGGHAAVLYEILLQNNHDVAGFSAPENHHRFHTPLPWLGNDAVIQTYASDSVLLVNGLGSTGQTGKRKQLFEQFRQQGYRFASLRHPQHQQADSCTHGEGLQALAGSSINTSAILGDNVLLNSRAIIEHHCQIGNHCHIATGAIICGDCQIENEVHIGAGAVIIQGIRIRQGAVIAAGAVVIHDVDENTLVAGNPATVKKKLDTK